MPRHLHVYIWCRSLWNDASKTSRHKPLMQTYSIGYLNHILNIHSMTNSNSIVVLSSF
jgi:hypothetical protein